jgi:hypothetical protein
MDSLTFKENVEYEVILSKLQLDVDRKTDRQLQSGEGIHEQDGGPAPEEGEIGRIQPAIPGQRGQGSVQAGP